MSALVPVDSVLSFPAAKTLPASDPSKDKTKKVFKFDRSVANSHAEHLVFGTVGVHGFTKPTKDHPAQQKQNGTSSAVRHIHTAPKVWFLSPNASEAERTKFLNNKKGADVLWVTSLKLSDLKDAFPKYFGKPEYGENADASLNVWLAAKVDDLVEALTIYRVLPPGDSAALVAAKKQFLYAHSFHPEAVLGHLNGKVNPKVDPVRQAEYNELVAKSKELHSKDTSIDINPTIIGYANDIAANFDNAHTRSDRVIVLDVNGSKICHVGEHPNKSVHNPVTNALDRPSIIDLDALLASNKTIEVSALSVISAGGASVKDMPSKDANGGWPRTTKKRPLGVEVTYRGKDGLERLLPADFFWSSNIEGAEYLVAELRVAKRPGQNGNVYSFNNDAVTAALVSLRAQLTALNTKTDKTAPKREVKKAKSVFKAAK